MNEKKGKEMIMNIGGPCGSINPAHLKGLKTPRQLLDENMSKMRADREYLTGKLALMDVCFKYGKNQSKE